MKQHPRSSLTTVKRTKKNMRLKQFVTAKCIQLSCLITLQTYITWYPEKAT